jgi:hypothetical protein
VIMTTEFEFYDPTLHERNGELRKKLGGRLKLLCFRGAVRNGYYTDWPGEVDHNYLTCVRPGDEGTCESSGND